jgi:hypothetical protein
MPRPSLGGQTKGAPPDALEDRPRLVVLLIVLRGVDLACAAGSDLAINEQANQAGESAYQRHETFCATSIKNQSDATQDCKQCQAEAEDLSPTLQATPMRRLVFGHLDDAVCAARQNGLVLRKHLGWRKRAAEPVLDLDDVTASAAFRRRRLPINHLGTILQVVHLSTRKLVRHGRFSAFVARSTRRFYLELRTNSESPSCAAARHKSSPTTRQSERIAAASASSLHGAADRTYQPNMLATPTDAALAARTYIAA